MPVILPDKEAIATWLDTSSGEFDAATLDLMKPFQSKLLCYSEFTRVYLQLLILDRSRT